MPSFLEIVAQARATLQQNGRVSLRALRREFELDDEALEDLIEELVGVQQVAERGDRMLTWRGAGESPLPPRPEAGAPAPQSPRQREIPDAAQPEPDSGERRQLTVMFCDLVGSTALAQRVDPEELRRIVREYRSVCVEATKRFEGHVAQYLGDGVLIYFGYPIAHEDAASRAIRAALEIQSNLADRPDIRRVGARIGIHTGLVVVDPTGDGDEALALGPTTNLAARIEAVAEPGSVVVSDATLALCRGAFLSKELGAHALKGIDEPVVLHRVEAPIRIRSGVDPEASSRPMVGREREIGTVLDRWEEAREAHGQVVLVSGEPGVGKSRLIQALRASLEESQHLWLDLRCSPYTQTSAFQPLVDLFGTGLGRDETAPPEEATQRLVAGLECLPGVSGEKVIPYLLSLLSLPPSERYPLPETSAEEQRERIFAALSQLMVHLSEQQPIVLVGEDLHWCDPSTLEYLGRIVAQAPTIRVLVVLTYRPEFEAPWSQSHVSELKLGRLPGRATRELIENAVGGKLPEAVLVELEARSDGVPLFMEELAASVVSSGVLIKEGERFELRGSIRDLTIPASLQDSLMARLDRLSASKHVAQQAATLGRTFSYALIEAVSDLDPPSLRTALGQLVEVEVLHSRGSPPDATYTFRHALLQDTAYESQLLSNRRTLHARIAAVLEEFFPRSVEAEPELMARHCEAAGDHAKAVGHFERAAGLALARVSAREAATHYASALASLGELPEDDERRQREVTLRLAQYRALLALHGFDRASDALDRVAELADELGEGPGQIPALLGLAVAQLDLDHRKAMEYTERLLPIVEPLGVPQLLAAVYVLQGVYAELHVSPVESVRLLRRALEIAGGVEFPPPATANDQDLVAMGHCVLAISLSSLGLTDSAMQSARAGEERARLIGNDYTKASIGGTLAAASFIMRDAEWARSLGDGMLTNYGGRGFHHAEGWCLVARGWGRVELGETEEGLRDIEAGIALQVETGGRAGITMCFVMAARSHRVTGDYDRCEAYLARAEQRARQHDELAMFEHLALERGRLHLARGQRDAVEAEPLFLEARELATAGSRAMLVLQADTELARLAPRTGRVRDAYEHLSADLARATEGFDRMVVRDAQAALEALKPLLS